MYTRDLQSQCFGSPVLKKNIYILYNPSISCLTKPYKLTNYIIQISVITSSTTFQIKTVFFFH